MSVVMGFSPWLSHRICRLHSPRILQPWNGAVQSLRCCPSARSQTRGTGPKNEEVRFLLAGPSPNPARVAVRMAGSSKRMIPMDRDIDGNLEGVS